MKRKSLLVLIFLLGMAAVALGIAQVGSIASSVRTTEGYNPAFDQWFAFLKRGVEDSAEMQRLIQTLPQPEGWVATYVTPYGPALASDGVPAKVVAANPGSLVGLSVSQIYTELPTGRWVYRSHAYYHGDPAKGHLAYALNVVVHVSAAPWAWLAIFGAVAAWLSLTGAVYMDARERGSGAVPGWTLLVFLTGPLGLAVWLISRLDLRRQAPARPCPGCGAELAVEHAFCVRCGHAARPACPDCRRPVEVEWGFCGTCGADLGQTEAL